MNKVFLIGRITKDLELKYTTNNIPTTSFSIAINRTYTNQSGEREADFINVVAWRKQAENLVKYMKKGSQIAVDGRIQTRNYDDKDGKKVYVTEVVADNIEFLESKGTRNENYDDIQTVDVKEDPYLDFGQEIELSDDDVAF